MSQLSKTTQEMEEIFTAIEKGIATLREANKPAPVINITDQVEATIYKESPTAMKAALIDTRAFISAVLVLMQQAYDICPLKDDHAVTKELGDTTMQLQQLNNYFKALIDGL